MKKTIIALAALAFSGAVLAGGPDPMAAPAAPQDNMYLGFNVAMTSDFATGKDSGSSTDYTVSSPMAFNSGGFQVGMMFGAIRAEIAADYSNGGADDDIPNSANLSVFVKGAYDLQLGHGLSVYPVAGIGLIHTFEDNGGVESSPYSDEAPKSSTDFGWLLGAGATLALNDKTSISGEYNWISSNRDDMIYSNLDKYTDFGANVFSVRWNRTF